MVDVLGRVRAEREGDRPVQRGVRQVILPANDMRDLEVEIVDDGRQVVRDPPVGAYESRPPLFAKAQRARVVVGGSRLEQTLGSRLVEPIALALPYGALFPADSEPLEIAEDSGLRFTFDPGRIRVVDPEDEHAVTLVCEASIRNRGESPAEVQRPGRARGEANACHRA